MYGPGMHELPDMQRQCKYSTVLSSRVCTDVVRMNFMVCMNFTVCMNYMVFMNCMVCTELRGMPECSGLQQSGTSAYYVQALAKEGKKYEESFNRRKISKRKALKQSYLTGSEDIMCTGIIQRRNVF
jgi:hypothetical protein